MQLDPEVCERFRNLNTTTNCHPNSPAAAQRMPLEGEITNTWAQEDAATRHPQAGGKPHQAQHLSGSYASGQPQFPPAAGGGSRLQPTVPFGDSYQYGPAAFAHQPLPPAAAPPRLLPADFSASPAYYSLHDASPATFGGHPYMPPAPPQWPSTNENAPPNDHALQAAGAASAFRQFDWPRNAHQHRRHHGGCGGSRIAQQTTNRPLLLPPRPPFAYPMPGRMPFTPQPLTPAPASGASFSLHPTTNPHHAGALVPLHLRVPITPSGFPQQPTHQPAGRAEAHMPPHWDASALPPPPHPLRPRTPNKQLRQREQPPPPGPFSDELQRLQARRTVYVCYIDPEVKEAALAEAFVGCGKVVDCRLCSDPNSSLRFAFIEFADEDAVPKALRINGKKLGTEALRVMRSRTAMMPVNKEYLPRSEQERERCSRTVYVANIDERLDVEDVQRFFGKFCGDIVATRLLRSTRNSTHIAFIEFALAEASASALHWSGTLLGSQLIRVSPSKTPIRMFDQSD